MSEPLRKALHRAGANVVVTDQLPEPDLLDWTVGTNNFTTFLPANIQLPPSLAIGSGSNVAFYGRGASGQEGIYARINDVLSKIADTNTLIPGGSLTCFATACCRSPTMLVSGRPRPSM